MLKTEEIRSLITGDRESMRKKRAQIGERYYDAKHDILDYKLYYVDGDGKVQEDTIRSNVRIPHPFFAEIVDQKVQYLLSGENALVTSQDPALQKHLDRYFGDRFIDELTEQVTGAAKHGWGYLYGYMDDDGRTRFEYADALDVTEVEKGRASDKKEHVLYVYTEHMGKDELVTHVQDWDDEQVTYYISHAKDGTMKDLALDDAQPINPRPHKLYIDKSKMYSDVYGRIPFFRLDNNRKQASDLEPIKALIDDYDLMACGLSNNLQDIAEGIYVVKGFDGTDMSEMIQNLRTKKAIGVDDGGGVDVKTINIPYEARQIKLELDEKNIYKFGMAFNAAQVGDGNVTNVVIKSRYALLDLKCNKIEARIRTMLRDLVELVIGEINKAEKTGYTTDDIAFDFARTIITSELDDAQTELYRQQAKQLQVDILLKTSSMLDNDTVVERICEVQGIDYEEIKDKLPGDPYDLDKAAAALEEAEDEAP